MPDIGKTKQGLRCCIVRHTDDKVRCTECPYRDPSTYCLNRLKNDALEAIEALSAERANEENPTCGPDYCEIE